MPDGGGGYIWGSVFLNVSVNYLTDNNIIMKKKNISLNRQTISRRTFVGNAAAGTAFIAFGPITNLFGKDTQQDEQWPSYATKFRFHMIGQAHIDPVWLWPWSEGISVVHSTFRSALDRMNETPDFCFTAS